ncbi:MAG: T9SS type A sorting domain-containing protein, partial [candidate division KSB1 bacterium]|nr:T9SS type A sorting domain-containing protein [candidate division KSB1 bacterium]
MSVQKQTVTFLNAALFLMLPLLYSISFAQGVIIDHTCTDITQIPESAIDRARSTLHIGYGHTSHGSQLTSGMTGLITFANNGGLGLSHAQNAFEWNNGGSGGALDLEEGDGYGSGWLDHDCGYYPEWVNETRAYLDDPSHSDVNVIIWSWCGQTAGRTEASMIDTYLAPMAQLESDYPDVVFVYMTGHADGSGESGNLHLRNRQIRSYCIQNDKVLYDFYDIECYDPDGNYFGDRYVNDDCSYDGGNWALEWQNAHTEGVDWYNCSSAHSQPLNANRKAYAAWWLWASLAGWNQTTDIDVHYASNPSGFGLYQNYPNPFNPETTIIYYLEKSNTVALKIYGVSGREIETLADGFQTAGVHTTRWYSKGLASGIYLCRLQAGNSTVTRKLILQ